MRLTVRMDRSESFAGAENVLLRDDFMMPSRSRCYFHIPILCRINSVARKTRTPMFQRIWAV